MKNKSQNFMVRDRLFYRETRSCEGVILVLIRDRELNNFRVHSSRDLYSALDMEDRKRGNHFVSFQSRELYN